jgi:hypothetical protein
VVVSGSRQDLTLAPSATTPECVLIWPGINLGDIFSEFYMVENRQSVENDDIGIVPDGLAIWHIDATVGANGNFEYNNINTDHKLIRLMEADGLEEIETGDGAVDSGDFYTDGDEFGPNTSPSSDKYDGTDSCVRVWDIAHQGPAPGAEISAAFSTICNQPPVCDSNGPYAAECQGATTPLTLDGTGSSDPDPGDIITYLWYTGCPGSFNDNSSATPVLTIDSTATCNVTLTVTDLEGDSDTDSSTVTISDTTLPDITCPSDMTIECDEPKDPSNTGLATATDLCDSDLSNTFTDTVIPGSCPEEETIVRTWTSTDGSGNSSSCVQTIEIVDSTPPVITCNAPATMTPPDAPTSYTATAIDNCAGDPSVEIIGYDCFKFTKKGKRIDKTESCIVEVSGDTVTIVDSGGVGDNLTWTVRANDNCGNESEIECEVEVVKKGKP